MVLGIRKQIFGGKRAIRALCSVLFFTFLTVCGATGNIPVTIGHQGYLVDSKGLALDGQIQLTFALYTVEVGGTSTWSESQTVQLNNGLYAVALGSVAALDPATIDGDLWLGVTVGSDTEMTPRQKLSSVAFALRAGVADSVADGAITDTKLSGTIDAARIPELQQLQTLVAQLQQEVNSLNSAPSVTIGAVPEEWFLHQGEVSLTGAVYDANMDHNDNLAVEWSFVSMPVGSSAVFSDSATLAASFTPDVEGTYVVRLLVTDPKGAWGSEMVTVNVGALRFVDNGDGTINDATTGLVWLQDVGCSILRGHYYDIETRLMGVNHGVCGLTDGSDGGAWRLPTGAEMNTLRDSRFTPQLSNAAGDAVWSEGDSFSNLQTLPYFVSNRTAEGVLLSFTVWDWLLSNTDPGWGYAFPVRAQ